MTIIFYDYYYYELIKKKPLSLLDCSFWTATPRLVSRSVSFFPVFVSFSVYDNHLFLLLICFLALEQTFHVHVETLPLLDHVGVGYTTLTCSTQLTSFKQKTKKKNMQGTYARLRRLVSFRNSKMSQYFCLIQLEEDLPT